MSEITLRVNGTAHRVAVEDTTLLLDALRGRVGVTSAREGCGVGACGACTVLADGMSVSSCLAPAVRYADTELTTADGLAEDDPVVSSFVDSDAMQCGYCIPGFLLSGERLLDERPCPSREDVAAGLSGNLCRCTGYYRFFEAVEQAAGRAVAP